MFTVILRKAFVKVPMAAEKLKKTRLISETDCGTCSVGPSLISLVVGINKSDKPLNPGFMVFSPIAFIDNPLSSMSSGKFGQNMQSAELKNRINELKTMMSTLELPVSATSAPSMWKFIAEKATQLDAYELKLPHPTEYQGGSTEQGDKIVQIKRYINAEGQPAREYLARIVKNSDITIIGEQHTLDGPNPHRVLGAQVLGELPPGSTLAVELPSSLKPIFEEFNNNQGSDLLLPSPIGNMLSMQPALSLLRIIKSNYPELVDMWKSARDKGVRVVPIDAELDSSVCFISELRESKIADELLALSDSAKGKPVVAWFGNMHAARGTLEGGVPSLAKRIAESSQFTSGNRILNTVLAQLSEKETKYMPLAVLAKDVREPVGMPTSKDGQETPIGKIPILDEASAKEAQADIKVSDYDHVILYPPTPPEALVNYQIQCVDALIAGLPLLVREDMECLNQKPLKLPSNAFGCCGLLYIPWRDNTRPLTLAGTCHV